MTYVVSSGDGVVVVRGAEAEVIGEGTPTSVRLMVDSSAMMTATGRARREIDSREVDAPERDRRTNEG